MFSPPGTTADMHIYRIRRQLFKGARHVLGGVSDPGSMKNCGAELNRLEVELKVFGVENICLVS